MQLVRALFIFSIKQLTTTTSLHNSTEVDIDLGQPISDDVNKSEEESVVENEIVRVVGIFSNFHISEILIARVLQVS